MAARGLTSTLCQRKGQAPPAVRYLTGRRVSPGGVSPGGGVSCVCGSGLWGVSCVCVCVGGQPYGYPALWGVGVMVVWGVLHDNNDTHDSIRPPRLGRAQPKNENVSDKPAIVLHVARCAHSVSTSFAWLPVFLVYLQHQMVLAPTHPGVIMHPKSAPFQPSMGSVHRGKQTQQHSVTDIFPVLGPLTLLKHNHQYSNSLHCAEIQPPVVKYNHRR